MSIYKGTQLISGVATPIEPTRNIGQIVPSLLPLADAGLHLLDGEVVVGNGMYQAFVEYISNLDLTASYFTTEANWQASVTQYGVCGKFVYDASANTVRLPKVSNYLYTEPFAETASVVGNGMALGLTDGTNNAGLNHWDGNALSAPINSYGLTVGTSSAGSGNQLKTNTVSGITTDPTKSGIEADLSNITTPLEGYYYIVVATSTKTDIEVNIDNVVTDLNQKVDKSSMVEVPTIIEVSDPSLMPSWYIVYSNGWCEQGGYYVPTATTGTITLLKAYKDTNYSITTGVNRKTDTTLYSPCVASTKIVSSFSVYVDNTANNVYWQTSGYIA